MASMTSIRAELGAYLKEQRQSAELSLRQLASMAGVSNPYLSQIERGLKKPSAEILQSLAKGLRISAESLYVRAGILDEQDPHQAEVGAAILGDPGLSERQKRVLLDIYQAFCSENTHAAGSTAEASEPSAAKPSPRPAAAKSPTAKSPTAKSPTRARTRATKKTTTGSSS
jgi:transcriptional regulator with XRE-family HTH domain